MPTIELNVESVTKIAEDVVLLTADVEEGVHLERLLYLEEIETIEKLAAWVLNQDLVPPVGVAELEGSFRVEYHLEDDVPVVDEVVRVDLTPVQ